MTQEIPFIAYIVAQAVGSAIETDQLLTDEATRTLTMPSWIKAGRISKISYYLDVTGAVTYQLAVLEGHSSGDVTQFSKEIFRSAAAQADATKYDDYTDRFFILDAAGTMYYIIDYTGAPGNTTGYIVVEGVAYV